MSADKDVFDPYHKWLGIPREQRPVTYYQLLGISPAEKDIDVIEDAAIRQSTHVRSYQLGPHVEICQRVLNEIAQARRVLLDPEKRRLYDSQLPIAAPKLEPAAAKTTYDTSAQPVVASKRGIWIGAIAGSAMSFGLALIAWTLMSKPDPPGTKSGHKPDLTEALDKKSKPDVEPKSIVKRPIDPPKIPATIPQPVPLPPKPNPSDGLIVKEFSSANARTAPLILMRTTDGIAMLSGAVGSLRGYGELVHVTPKNGEWMFEGRGLGSYRAYVLTVTGLPAEWFDFEHMSFGGWSYSKGYSAPPHVLGGDRDGICWLTQLSGDYDRGGVSVRLLREKGLWLASGTSRSPSVYTMAAFLPFGPKVDRTRLRLSEIEWQPNLGSIPLLDLKDGFCVLTGISGGMKTWGEEAKLIVKDGMWRMEGRDGMHALAIHVLRISLTGQMPEIKGATEIVVARNGNAILPSKSEVKGGSTSAPEYLPAPERAIDEK